MNARSFKVIFSKRLGALVAVGENAASQGKGACGEGARGVVVEAASALSYVGALKTLCLAALVGTMPKAFALDANALPSGGEVRHGAATVGSEGATMTINQTSSRATINWQSFNVGSGAKVNIVQPSSSAALLNRVVGNEMSQIHGQINANGQVVLVNPNGVLVGSSGAITASAFTATTFGISDADFEAGNMRFTRNGSNASVDNQGSISTNGGYVALIGASVSNSGIITTGGGNALLGAGDAVSIPLGSNIRLELDPAAFASVDNSGTITTNGGQVFMRASAVIDAVSKVANATVTHSGTINTSGGRVDVLADQGTVRVSGNVVGTTIAKDNSGTSSNVSNSTQTSGSIFIGRDEKTNVLAAIGDVRDATLESQGGFIETSGSYLATDRVKITAKDWLLDPSNILITSAADSNVTGTIPADIMPTSGSATSVVNVETIKTAINGGTNVTITTTNNGTAGSGVGNITVNSDLNFTNNSGNERTLKLIADNGIFVNADITTGTGTGNGLVNINLLAKGQPNGVAFGAPGFTATNSSGIVLNKNIITNGSVTIDGTNNNTGVNSRGITFNSGSSIKGASFDIKGTATGLATGSHGVHMAGNNTFTSSSTTVTSQINGIAKTNGSIPGTTNFNGITAATNINGNVTFDAGNGSMVVKGSNTNSQLGVRVSESGGATNIKTRGEVTLGALEDNSVFSMRIGSITAETGNLIIRGQATGALKGVTIIDSSSLKTLADGKNIDIVGRVNTTSSGQSAIGVEIGRFPNAPQFDSKGNINIEGTVTGAGLGSGVAFTESGWGSQTSVMKATGDITIRGNNRALETNTAHAVSLIAGLDATAGGKITLQAETNNANANAIQMSSRTAILNGAVTPLAGNTTLKATGDVLIQANRGGIIMNSSPLVTTPTLISGKNITIDNTGAGMTVNGTANANGGSIDANGTITAGTGKATNVGVLIADGRAITATGNLNIAGASTGAVGINTNGVLTATNNVNLTGTSSGINANAHGVMLTGKVNSTAGAVNITGSSAASNGGAGAIIQATVDAKNNITLDGRSGNTNNVQGLVIQEAVTSVEGDITVTGQNMAANASPSLAITLLAGTTYGSLNTKADNKKITINANTLYINQGSSGSGASVNAGSTGKGTVHIKTLTAGNAIEIGAADTPSGTLSNQKLGIDQTELNRITAGKLEIGDTASTGNITVSGAATTAASTGNITLQTGGNIAVNAALTVEATKNLTLDAGGAITNATNGKLTATELMLKAGSTIGADGAAIKTNVEKASLTSAGSQFLIEDNKVTVAAKTTGNGDINITTTDGKMTVGTFNGVTGIDAGTGNVGLTAASGLDHGIYMSSDVKGKDITVNATANNGSGLGFYGAGGSFTASGMLNLTGTATGTGNGFYSFGGTHTAQTGINITGTSANGQGVGFDKNVVLTNASNDIVITGTSNGAGTNTEAIGLRGSSITNTNGNIKLVAVKGNVFTNSEGGTPGQYWGLTGPLTNTITNNGTGEIQILAGATATDTGAIDGKVLNIIQNGNGGVLVKTTGTGNVIAPKITNAGTGNVVIAAGSELPAGDGSGGQVLTSSSSSVTQTSSGKTFIYSGNAAGTGVLANLDSTLGALRVDGTATQNADTNAAFGTGAGISVSTAKAQAIFREKLTVAAGVVAGTTLVKTYGDDSTENTANAAEDLLAEAKDALTAANSGSNSTFATAPEGTKNRIVVSKAVVVDSLNNAPPLTGGETEGQFSTAGFLKAKTGTYQFAGFTSSKYDVTGVVVGVDVAKRDIIIAATPTTVTFSGGTQTQAARTQTGEFLTGDQVVVTGGAASGTAVGTYNDGIAVAAAVADDLANYNVQVLNAPLTIAAAPVGPVGPVIDPVDPIDPFIPNINPVPVANLDAGGARGTATLAAGLDAGFQLASAEQGQCTQDTLAFCECETAKDDDGLNIEGVQLCFEPQRGAELR